MKWWDKCLLPCETVLDHCCSIFKGSWSPRTHIVMCSMSHFYTKHLFSINWLHRSCTALPPHFHFPPSSPPLGRCTPVPFVLSTSVAMETLLLFSLLPSYQEQPWTQCQDLLCTDSIFFQCLDKSAGKPCLHFSHNTVALCWGHPFPMDPLMLWRWFLCLFLHHSSKIKLHHLVWFLTGHER